MKVSLESHNMHQILIGKKRLIVSEPGCEVGSRKMAAIWQRFPLIAYRAMASGAAPDPYVGFDEEFLMKLATNNEGLNFPVDVPSKKKS